MSGWWEGYFDEVFLDVYRALLPESLSADEAEAVMEVLDLRQGASVLDLGCGWGRHAVELADRGLRVTGVDLSERLLQEARAASAERGVVVEWLQGDIRDLPTRGPFDAVLSLFSSLGYFLSDEEDLRALASARRVLAPGGALLVETMHRDLLAREFAERDWWEGPDGEPVLVEREFDAVAGISREWLRWRGAEKYHEIRVRGATEWSALLDRAGFEAELWLGSWDLTPFTHQSERLIIVARPRPNP